MGNFNQFIILFLIGFLTPSYSANSISEQLQLIQQNQQAQKESEQNVATTKIQEDATPSTQYNYRAPPSAGYNNYQVYPRDIYTSLSQATVPVPVSQPKGNIIQMASGGDWFLTTQIGQVFWGFVGVAVCLALIIFAIKYIGSAFDVPGLVQQFRDGARSGRTLDLNHVTNMVYKAIDAYEKMGTDSPAKN